MFWAWPSTFPIVFVPILSCLSGQLPGKTFSQRHIPFYETLIFEQLFFLKPLQNMIWASPSKFPKVFIPIPSCLSGQLPGKTLRLLKTPIYKLFFFSKTLKNMIWAWSSTFTIVFILIPRCLSGQLPGKTFPRRQIPFYETPIFEQFFFLKRLQNMIWALPSTFSIVFVPIPSCLSGQ